jgi:hypothetical protein
MQFPGFKLNLQAIDSTERHKFWSQDFCVLMYVCLEALRDGLRLIIRLRYELQGLLYSDFYINLIFLSLYPFWVALESTECKIQFSKKGY